MLQLGVAMVQWMSCLTFQENLSYFSSAKVTIHTSMLASKIYVSTSIKKSLTKDIEKKEGTILKEKCIWKEIERVADGELFLYIKKDVFI